MPIYRAMKTMQAIDEALEADQGASFREWLGKVIPHMKDAFNPERGEFRSHLGASLIGRECARELWYSFHWTTDKQHKGRIIRLFNRGHLEEARFIALLLMIGCQVYQQDEQGNQFRITDAKGHFGGSGDGVAVGIPDLDPNSPALLEFKTHGDKSFKALIEEGVRAAKFEHFVQMNMYMKKMGINFSLYMAVNKNDDAIHAEIVPVDHEISDQFIVRANKLVFMQNPPPKMNNSPGFYKCKFCDHHAVCHMGAAPAVNCRTCKHSVPVEDGQWACKLHDFYLSKEQQLKGCEQYSVHKDM